MKTKPNWNIFNILIHTNIHTEGICYRNIPTMAFQARGIRFFKPVGKTTIMLSRLRYSISKSTKFHGFVVCFVDEMREYQKHSPNSSKLNGKTLKGEKKKKKKKTHVSFDHVTYLQ